MNGINGKGTHTPPLQCPCLGRDWGSAATVVTGVDIPGQADGIDEEASSAADES